ncbi:MAG: hypothetical protein GTN35_03840 [Nitrososphaeria archaeon]|nr:hypothetical protein [Nitrosopumilaceae archaeon]NIP10150.1 hypothetical protein [Nitrosopumilaceae archaeon]NIP91514.1 hypothetical protein [Nitrososphaeria archaeon]NIS95349.1 hypothetical protein [Nitrosopumilaceae archaeon]
MKVISFVLGLLIFVPVSYAFSEEYEDAKIYWKDEIVSPNSFAKITVEDNDMNHKEYPHFADKLSIIVWSDSSQDPIELELVETGIFTGMFSGKIYISDSQGQGKSLFVNSGDFIYAKYIDSTTTTGSQIDATAAAVVKVSGKDMTEFLEKLDPSMRPPTKSQVPEWIKNNALWWGQGQIDDSSFVEGIQFLIREKILEVSPPSDKSQRSENIPDWIKTNALWWAQGQTSDQEFISAIGHLIGLGIISIEPEVSSQDSKPKSTIGVDPELEKCKEITKAYERLNCEKEAKFKANVAWYKENADAYDVGPITFFYPGLGTPGNTFEINSSGQALLYIRMLVENNSSENVSLFCSGPSVCNYDIWNGQKVFKYSSQDFTSGQIVLKQGDQKEFNMFFGPNIGYGGTEFEYDSSKEYFFRISEPWGSFNIPLKLQN